MTTPPKYEELVLKVAELERREDALREELSKFKACCVDLSSQVRELEHKMDYYKGEGMRADSLQQRLTVAEQRSGELETALVNVRETLDREYWDQYAGLDETRDILDAALKPAAEGEGS